LESNHFVHVLRVCVTHGFMVLSSHLREAFATSLASNQKLNVGSSTAIPMPKIIPLVKKQFNVVVDTTPSQKKNFYQEISSMKDLEEYSYYIFTSSYDEA